MNKQVQPKSKPKTKSRKTLKNTVSTFISKTYEILEDNQFPDIVDWNLDGTAIVIKNPLEFSQKVLNQYFKHKNLTSFVRQLNMYGFHKQRTLKIEHIYSHELFQRNKKHLLDQIKRKIHDQINIDTTEPLDKSEVHDSNQDVGTLLQERQVLKRYNIQASSKINNLEGKVKDLVVQNQTLREQITQHDEKDKILISLMASILKKYGIPPTELSSIFRDSVSVRGPGLQPTVSLESNMNTLPSLMHIEPQQDTLKDDVGNFLNLNMDGGSKMASTVLHNMTNFDDKTYTRDISPSAMLNTKNEINQGWDSALSRQKIVTTHHGMKHLHDRMKDNMLQGGMLINPKYLKEKEKSSTRRLSGSRARIMISNDGTMVKRMFDDEGSGEVIAKKIEFNPIIKRSSCLNGPFEG